jgi:hypothetical protein
VFIGKYFLSKLGKLSQKQIIPNTKIFYLFFIIPFKKCFEECPEKTFPIE